MANKKEMNKLIQKLESEVRYYSHNQNLQDRKIRELQTDFKLQSLNNASKLTKDTFQIILMIERCIVISQADFVSQKDIDELRNQLKLAESKLRKMI